jgi:hypothetical protein
MSNSFEPGKLSQRTSRLSKKSKVILVGVAVVLVALIVGSVATIAFYSIAAPRNPSEGLGIEGVATITLYGPSGQTLGVWSAHNSLVALGKDGIAKCLSGVSSGSCPGAPKGISSFTSLIEIAVGTCTNAESNCGISSSASNTLTPNSCASLYQCSGWIASATFTPSNLFSPSPNGCSSTCNLNDVVSSWTPWFGISGTNFDDIPSANFPSPISIAPGDSLAVNIQFTVS